jgi:uncharacterized protein (DUF1778 family)
METFERAARVEDMGVNEFIVASAAVAADRVLADSTRFAMAPGAWEGFAARLDGTEAGSSGIVTEPYTLG